jgi:glycogenin
MSQDPAPFVPPERYPSPPKGMWYEVPKEPPAAPRQQPRAIFPWEGHQPRASRIFTGEPPLPNPSESTSEPGERKASSDSRAPAEPSFTESSATDQKSEPATPTTPNARAVPSDPWGNFTRTNAWDEVPEIERYVEGLQKHRRGKSQVLTGISGSRAAGFGAGSQEGAWKLHGMRLTDFPSEVERPSLPVTPAPIRRPKFWGGGTPGIGDGDDDQLLPAAEGVPTQSDWVCVHGNWWSPADCLCDLTNVLRYYKDPVAQLQKLARQQSEVLLKRLGGEGGEAPSEGSEIPSRPLPFGSEGVTSPTYVAQTSGAVVLSPQPVKGNTASMVRAMGEQEPSAIPRTASQAERGGTWTGAIPLPSYTGPGVAWEKGEDLPVQETPMPPSEEERDVLDT